MADEEPCGIDHRYDFLPCVRPRGHEGHHSIVPDPETMTEMRSLLRQARSWLAYLSEPTLPEVEAWVKRAAALAAPDEAAE